MRYRCYISPLIGDYLALIFLYFGKLEGAYL